jgi:hypothetical protein
MPYNNQYNSNVAQIVRGYSQKHINRENAVNDFSTSYEIPSMVEASVLKNPEVHGGSGFGAATVQDLGFEPTLGATSGEGVPKRVRKKMIEVGEGLSAAGVSAAGVSAAGVSAAGKPKRAPKKNLQVPVPEAIETVAEGVSAGSKPKRTRKKKGDGVSGGALLSLKDLGAMHGQPEPTVRAKVTVKAEGADRTVGEGMSGGLRRKRIEIVKEVMKKHKLSLPAASKYVKEHKLY